MRCPVLRGNRTAPEREDREKLGFETEKNGKRDICFWIVEKVIGPAELDEHGADCSEDDEIIPALAKSDSSDADIQDRNIAEERG